MKEARRSGVKFGRKAKLSFARIVKARKLIERAEDVGRALECEPRHPVPSSLARLYVHEY
jgi:hypothetical protein